MMNPMKLTRRILSLAAALTVLFSLGTPVAHAANGDAYQPEYTHVDPDNEILYVISDKAGNDATGMSQDFPVGYKNLGLVGWTWGKSLSDPLLNFTDSNLPTEGAAVLQNCSKTVSNYCVESLDLASPGQDFKPASFVREANDPVWPPDPALNYPGGSGPSLYTADFAPTMGGQVTYAALATLKLTFDWSTKKFVAYGMRAAVLPYRAQYDSQISGTPGSYVPYGEACSWKEPSYCGVAQDWVPGTRARLKIRIPSSFAGWFKGRIQSPTIDITPVNSSTNELTVEAEPVQVPQLAIAKSIDFWEQQKQNNIDTGWWGGPGFRETGTGSGEPWVDKFIERFRTDLHDTATGVWSMWNFASIGAGNGSPCLRDTTKVMGIVTTNAMGYDGNSPSFENGILTYHVSGLHYAPDGKTLNEGTYDLVMRSDTARCLYGFSKAPIQATISVIDDKGEAKTAVTTVNEKDGWLTMRAYGFTFSNPTLKVKLTQPTEAAAGSTPPSSPAAKTTITCVKGKLTKKVSGTAPKCPAGYKKK